MLSYLCVVCTCSCSCVYVYIQDVQSLMHVGVPFLRPEFSIGWCWMFPVSLSTLYFELGFLIDLELTDSTRLAISRDPSVSAFTVLRLKMCAVISRFYVYIEDHHDCVTLYPLSHSPSPLMLGCIIDIS